MKKALGIYRELLAAEVVERIPPAQQGPDGRTVRLTVHLQPNFALNQPLSPFALAALELLDPESPSYALDVVSVIEATLEKPRQILSAQQKKARGEAIAAMKADGIEYDQRMAMLDEVTYPQPLADILGEAFEVYRKAAPWVGDFELAPKSVVRDMYERAMNFGEFVQFYGLARSEGIVLRYLADAFKALRQTVPQDMLREDLEDLNAWLGELVRQVDSSLLDEWEELASGAAPDPARRAAASPAVAHVQHPRLPGHGAQRDVPPRGAVRGRGRRCPGRTGRRRRLGRRTLGGRPRRLLRRAQRHRHRPGRPRARAAHHHRGTRGLEGPADL
jgi:hypothetical protein